MYSIYYDIDRNFNYWLSLIFKFNKNPMIDTDNHVNITTESIASILPIILYRSATAIFLRNGIPSYT